MRNEAKLMQERGARIERAEDRTQGYYPMNFENLEVWQRARRLSVAIYRNLTDLKDRTFRDQITRSSLSMPSNVAEGFERQSQKDCIVFLSYAKGSCGELRTQIYIGMDIGYIPKDVGQQWLAEATEISLMLGGLARTKRGFIRAS